MMADSGSASSASDLIQIGWWLPDEFAPERMSRAEWESERLVTLWQVEDEGGFTPEWQERAIPVYIERESNERSGQVMSDTAPRPPAEETMKAALAPFGWICTEEFWSRYYADAWVFNLANAVERLSVENERLRGALAQENANAAR